MHTVFILLGSNIGDRLRHFADAELSINQLIGITIRSSSVYETAPWGYTDQPAFLNKVIELKSELSPAAILKNILAIETKLGRTRSAKWHERIIDIDILFYNEAIINLADLTIPHPHLHERRFTLVPLNEIAPNLIHPVLKKSICELTIECTDKSQVEKLS